MVETEQQPHISRIGRFLIGLSGARIEVLRRCPTERIKFQSLGWAILITSGMATVSMWFALTSAMGFNPGLSFPVALLWGFIIMGIDRWLVTSMPLAGKRKFLIAAPRLALAILLGSLISTPIVLRIFQSEINNQISIIKENNEAAFLTSQQRGSVQARVNTAQAKVTNLEQVIDSRGAVAINPASDPVVQGLTSQLTNERKVAATDYHAWQCQLYGGCGAPRGSGPLAAASKARYDADETQISTLTSQIQARAAAAVHQHRLGGEQAAAGQERAARRAGPAGGGAGRGGLAAQQLPGHEQRHQRAADPAQGARPALGRRLNPPARAPPAVPAVPGHRGASGDGQAASATGKLRADPA